MSKKAIYVHLVAKPGKEAEVEQFLTGALPLVQAEPKTVTWFALREKPGTYSIFDTFDDDGGRDAHLNGKVAAALMSKAKELFSNELQINKIDILADKLPGK